MIYTLLSKFFADKGFKSVKFFENGARVYIRFKNKQDATLFILKYASKLETYRLSPMCLREPIQITWRHDNRFENLKELKGVR